jgi:hypothetical protein
VKLPRVVHGLVALVALVAIACTHGAEPAAAGLPGPDGGASAGLPDGGGGGVGEGGAPDGGGTGATDPLHTGLIAAQTGVSVDAFDAAILAATAKYAEPDAMIFKAIVYVESRFDATSVACPNLPCGLPTGWTDAESRCYGLMQIVPACNGIPKIVLLPTGHPNLTKDPSSSDWAGSVFNPSVNVDVGVSGIAGNRGQVMKEFAGCTTEQYTLMAIGNYNSYGSTKSCTVYSVDYTTIVLDAYKQYATAAGYAPHAY